MLSVQANVLVPKDAHEFKGRYYKIFQSKASWKEVVKQYESKGGLLASDKSKEMNDFVVRVSAGKCLCLGGFDEKKEGEWLWRDGSKMKYSNWASHEPDDW